MTNDVGRIQASRIEESHDIAHQLVGAVRRQARRTGAWRITAQIRGKHTEAGFGQDLSDSRPRGRILWEAVQQHYRLAVLRAVFGNL